MKKASFLAVSALILLAAWALVRPPAAGATEYLADEITAPPSADQVPSPLEESFREPPTPVRMVERIKKALADLPPVISGSSLNLRLRTSYFDRQTVGGKRSEAWAAGGWLTYQSGWLADYAQFGATVYTSQPLDAPDDRGGSLLLAPGQEAITVLGQAYLRLRPVEGTHLTLYRQELDLPFINRQDNRMIPNTFEGIVLASRTWPAVRFVAGHLTAMKKRDANSFVSMSEAAGYSGTDNGLTMAGLLLSKDDWLDWGFINQYGWNYLNTFYSEANASWKDKRGGSWKLSGQYARQTSVGDQLGGSSDTWFAGARASAGLGGAVLTLAFSYVDDGAAVLFPYGGYPGYLSLMVRKFNRAEERAWLLGLSYDFANLGLDGFSGFANFARGYNPDNGPNAYPDEQELNLTLDWRPKAGWAQGAWLRLRAAYVSEDNGQSVNEYQLIFNYDLELL